MVGKVTKRCYFNVARPALETVINIAAFPRHVTGVVAMSDKWSGDRITGRWTESVGSSGKFAIEPKDFTTACGTLRLSTTLIRIVLDAPVPRSVYSSPSTLAPAVTRISTASARDFRPGKYEIGARLVAMVGNSIPLPSK